MKLAGALSAAIRGLPAGDRRLLTGLLAAALAALGLGLGCGFLAALARAGWLGMSPDAGYRLMGAHGVAAFFYWLYFAQAGLLLAIVAAYAGGDRGIAWGPVAWLGFAAMLAGFAANLWVAWFGPVILYDGSPEPVGEEGRAAAAAFYAGYLALSAGLAAVALAAVATALRAKAQGGASWPAVTFGAVAWAGLLMVSGVAAFGVFGPALQWTLGLGELPANHQTRWHVLFHNMHYLPLMGTVLVWYVLVREMVGIASIFGERFSKLAFAVYLLFVPPTSLYHMFLDPGLDPTVQAVGSVLSLFISVPTVAVFLVIVASLEAHGRAAGARGWFGWLARLPWRDPAMTAMALAAVNLAIGGSLSFVLIQPRLAPLLSDTFFVPAYFHFLTIGAVSLSLLAAATRVLPAASGRQPWAQPWLARAPFVVTAGLLLFGLAGLAAGLSGMPRRVIAADYDGAAPALWGVLSGLVGLGATVMAAGLAIYVVALLGPLLVAPKPAKAAAALDLSQGERAGLQAAWSGPLAVALLVAVMAALTALAFQRLHALPLLGS
jgi:cytochrome c oxidase subunit I